MSASNSIVVVNFNAKASLETMLTALKVEEAVTTEVIVVDSMSFDGSADMVRQKFKGVRLIALDENRGFAAAVNRGLREAAGDVAVICHSDIISTAQSSCRRRAG